MVEALVQTLVGGATIGSIYALVAIGFVVIYRALGIFNFAQTEFYMLGAMAVAVLLATGMPVGLAFVGSVAIVLGIGLLAERAVFRYPVMAGIPTLNLDVASIALAIVLRSAVLLILGPQPRAVPPLVAGAVHIGSAIVSWEQLLIIAITAVAIALVYAFLNLTRAGLALRATASNRSMAAMFGIRTTYVLSTAFGMSAVLGALAGVLIAPIFLAQFDMGLAILVKAFAAWVLGGLTSVSGVIVGGLVLGLAESFAGNFISAAYGDVVAFVVLLLVLAIRPSGILGRNRPEKV